MKVLPWLLVGAAVVSMVVAGVLLFSPRWDATPMEVVRRYRAAWLEGRREDLWDLLSEEAHNICPRERFLREVDLSNDRDLLSRIDQEAPTIEIEGDVATVRYSKLNLRIILGREDGGWRVHMHTVGPGYFKLCELEPGRVVPVLEIIWHLVRKDQEIFDRWEPRLPRIRGGAREGELRDTTCISLFVDASGRVTYRMEEHDVEELRKFLRDWADTHRNLCNPQGPTEVHIELFLDRGLQFAELRRLLLLLTDPPLDYRRLFVTAHLEWGGGTMGWRGYRGIQYSIDWVIDPARVEVAAEEAPKQELVIRAVEEANTGDDLGPALAGAKHVHVRCGPNVRAERLLEVLFVLAQVEDLRVTLDVREPAVPETRWEMELNGKPVRTVTFPDKGNPDVTFTLYRKLD